MKREVLTLRGIILGASPQIREGVKWKSPSFRTTEFFATLNLRAGKILLILHSGAKLNKNSTDGMAIPDPGGLLKWLAKDRASVAFETATDVRGKKAGLTAILREWIRYV